MGDVEPVEHQPATLITVAHVVDRYIPGSYGPEWTWDDEQRDLYGREPEAMAWFEDKLRLGEFDAFTDPILIGDDGRVWDGHHRICAALRLQMHQLPVEFVRPGPTP